jgi:hypothetical protein
MKTIYMLKFLHNLFFKSDDKAERLQNFFNEIKITGKEKPPTSAKVFTSTVPGGISMEAWMSGEWSRIERDSDKKK